MCFYCLSLSQQSITHPRYSNHGKPCDIPDASMDNNERNLGDDIDNDDDDDDSDHSFVPNESELESFSEESSEEEEEDEEHDMVGGKKIEPDITTPVTRKTSIGLPKETSTKTNSTSSRKTRSRERVSSIALTDDCSVLFMDSEHLTSVNDSQLTLNL